MKALKKIVALFTAALFVMLPIFTSTMTAKAEGNAVTYYLKYVDAEQDWRFQTGAWDNNSNGRELYYLYQDIKDGDLIVIDGTQDLTLNVDVKLSNLTIVNGVSVVAAKSIDDFYLLNNSTAAITGNITNAYIYNYGVANLNSNVTNLYLTSESTYDDPDATVVAVGTVAHVKGYDAENTWYEYYNFKANTFHAHNGNVITAEENFSKTPTAAAPAPSAPSASAGELDDVPKTGDFSVSPIWFVAIAVVCMLGYRKLERR